MSTRMNRPMKAILPALIVSLVLSSLVWSENQGTEGFAVEWQQRSNFARNKAVRPLPRPPAKPRYTSEYTDQEPFKHARLGALILTRSNAAGLGVNFGVAFTPRFGLDLQAAYLAGTNTTVSPDYVVSFAPSFFITDYVGFALGASYNISSSTFFVNTDLMVDLGFIGGFIGLRHSVNASQPGMFIIGVSTRL